MVDCYKSSSNCYSFVLNNTIKLDIIYKIKEEEKELFIDFLHDDIKFRYTVLKYKEKPDEESIRKSIVNEVCRFHRSIANKLYTKYIGETNAD